MKTIYTTLCLLFALSFSALATNYVVSGTGTNIDGIYNQSGICNSRQSYSMTNGGNTYTIIYDGNEWSIGQSFGGCNNMGDYTNPNFTGLNAGSTPPATGWQARFGGGSGPFPTVVPEGRYIAKDKMYIVENIKNDGSITETVSIRFNKFNGDIYTGTTAEDYVTLGKAILTNIPSGLIAKMIRNSDSTLTLSFTGNAANHTHLNDANVRIDFTNSAFSGGDTSKVAFHTDTLKIFFRDVLTVAHTGADYTTIGSAMNASKKFDIIDIAADTFTETNLTINHPLYFRGKAADKTIIQGSANPFTTTSNMSMFELWYNDTTTSVFSDLTLQNGFKLGNSCAGGAIWSVRGSLTLNNCRIINNEALSNGLQAFAGGVCGNHVKIYNCEFSGNKTINTNPDFSSGGCYGGGLLFEGNATIVNSTFSNNLSRTGAGIYASNSPGQTGQISNFINVTITNNKGDASSVGAGLYSRSKNILNLKNVIIYEDSAISASDLYNTGVTVNATNCIIGVTSEPLTTNLNGSTSNPLLSALANNGGATQTHALKPGSPAINTGVSGSDVPAKDQRGLNVNGIRDIGAYEYNGCTLIDTGVTVHNDTIISNQLNATSYQWLDCNNNYAAINNETKQRYIATNSGSYAVVVTIGACSDTSACVNIIVTNVPKLNKLSEIIVYPNPATNNLTITNITQPTTLRLYDTFGKLIVVKETENNTTLNISNLSQGIYTLVSEFNKGRVFTKVVISK